MHLDNLKQDMKDIFGGEKITYRYLTVDIWCVWTL